MNYRVIALDLDGTLLTPEKTILPESLQALARARAAGYQVLIVTGRHHVAIHPFYQALELTTPVICCNGAYIYDYQARQVLQANPISPQQASQVLDLMHDYRIEGFMYVDDAMLYQNVTHLVSRMLRWSQTLAASLRPVITQVASLHGAVHEVKGIWKFALSDDDNARLREFATAVTRQLALECEWSWLDQLDVGRSGNNKGQRLAEWAETAGISMAEIIAFGDNYNDISMLEVVGLGVAMDNADDAVKAHAKLVTSSNRKAGIAQVLKQYLGV